MENLLTEFGFDPEDEEVFRALGYPDAVRVSEPVRTVCRAQRARFRALARVWGSCREVSIATVERDSVRLASGERLRSRRVARMLRHATSLHVCLVTVGPAVGAEIRQLIADNCTLEALALDAVATAATHALMGQLHERICREAAQRSCGTTVPYGPGYSGWDLRDLAVVFSCLGDADVPVRLNEQSMMIPAQSLLCVIGVVPGRRRTPRAVVPCRLCELAHCSVRRAPYRGAGRESG